MNPLNLIILKTKVQVTACFRNHEETLSAPDLGPDFPPSAWQRLRLSCDNKSARLDCRSSVNHRESSDQWHYNESETLGLIRGGGDGPCPAYHISLNPASSKQQQCSDKTKKKSLPWRDDESGDESWGIFILISIFRLWQDQTRGAQGRWPGLEWGDHGNQSEDEFVDQQPIRGQDFGLQGIWGVISSWQAHSIAI